LETGAYSGQEPSEERIQQLREDIERYREIVERRVEAAGQLSVFHRMLALEYLDRSMYGLALESLGDAIQITPENEILHFYAGVSAARMAKSVLDREESAELFRRAEDYYQRAVELDGRYVEALYALGVLYTFEINRPSEALEPLRQALEVQENNLEVRFVLGNALVQIGRREEAVSVYEEILRIASDADTRRRARELIATLEGRDDG
jgi:tetratricopeptide (TPR) repeat protein